MEDKKPLLEEKRSLNNKLFAIKAELLGIESDTRKIGRERLDIEVAKRQAQKKMKRLSMEKEKLEDKLKEFDKKMRFNENEKYNLTKKLDRVGAELKIIKEKESKP
ncbi:MAG: hypothetical protein U9M90_00160 [Patescibacteria group bacterium]|nr:hypothetical protein [Patescibacteria group bacterium]